MPDQLIKFEAIDTGRKGPDGSPVYDIKYDIKGEDVEIFCLLAEIIHLHPGFKNMVIRAIEYDRKHDRENCPHCRKGGMN